MPGDYYQNILYPLQDKVLDIISPLPVDFYLTGGTALSRGYLNHRYSDDLDFFVNAHPNFSAQVEKVVHALENSVYNLEVPVADIDFTRLFIYSGTTSLKVEMINDVAFRSGVPTKHPLFPRTDNVLNILSNKLCALNRNSAKDIVDLVFISCNFSFNWTTLFKEAARKDMWINPVNAANMLDTFQSGHIQTIKWIGRGPDQNLFLQQLSVMISDILSGGPNNLYSC